MSALDTSATTSGTIPVLTLRHEGAGSGRQQHRNRMGQLWPPPQTITGEHGRGSMRGAVTAAAASSSVAARSRKLLQAASDGGPLPGPLQQPPVGTAAPIAPPGSHSGRGHSARTVAIALGTALGFVVIVCIIKMGKSSAHSLARPAADPQNICVLLISA